jgi:hypothetical protein
MNLDDHFAPAVEGWRTSAEAKALARLRAEHRRLAAEAAGRHGHAPASATRNASAHRSGESSGSTKG